MSKKLVWLGLLFLVLAVYPVSADFLIQTPSGVVGFNMTIQKGGQPYACNWGGGIWCSNTQRCHLPSDGRASCIVEGHQNVFVTDNTIPKYLFSNLTVNGRLSFFYGRDWNLWDTVCGNYWWLYGSYLNWYFMIPSCVYDNTKLSTCVIGGSGGIGEVSGKKGGGGGCAFSRANSARPGANVSIDTVWLYLQGNISVSGESKIARAIDGFNADRYTGDHGGGGYGGSGGGGGGFLNITAVSTFLNGGYLFAEGGIGQQGGMGGNDPDGHSWRCMDGEPGGAGGGGGGGAGGRIILNTTYVRKDAAKYVSHPIYGTSYYSIRGGDGGYGGLGGSDSNLQTPSSCSRCGGLKGCTYSDIMACVNDYGECVGNLGVVVGGGGLSVNFTKEPLSGVPLGDGVPRTDYGPNGKSGKKGADGLPSLTIVPLQNTIERGDSPSFDACNNRDDDDLDSRTDMLDDDCFNLSSTTTSCFSKGGTCPSTNCGPIKLFSELSSPPSWFYASAANASDACCGDDPAGDYGHIISDAASTTKKFLCYDSLEPQVFANPSPDYTWLDAMETYYEITPVSSQSKIVDAISNNREWYYCDASGRSLLTGTRVSEGQSFVKTTPSGQITCTELYTSVISGAILAAGGTTPVRFEDCPIGFNPVTTPTHPACCRLRADPMNPGSYIPRTTSINDISNCEGYCYMENSAQVISDLCTVPGTSLNTCPQTDPDDPNGATPDLIKKSFCGFDLTSCLRDITPNSLLSCDGQDIPGFNFDLCEGTEVCTSGRFVTTTEAGVLSHKCCFGVNASCAARTNVLDDLSCESAGGRIYSDVTHDCIGDIVPYSLISSCCFGYINLKLDLALSSSVDNASFLCFKQNGQDMFSDCCYDSSCPNANLLVGGGISAAKNRVSSLGSSIHTIENFDKTDTGGYIEDYVQRLYIDNAEDLSAQVDFLIWDTPMRLEGFTYLEFDIAYTNPNMDVIINGLNMGKLSQYLTNGDSKMRWHHAVINLKSDEGLPLSYLYDVCGTDYEVCDLTGISTPAISLLESEESLTSITFMIHTDVPSQLVIDNIVLTPNIEDSTDMSLNTRSNYCTGGFGGWIKDLDPASGADLNDWNVRGAHMMTCDSQASYAWTGTKCCGDDTKFNYGEFYNDTMYGCFNGTVMHNGWPVWYAKNFFSDALVNVEKYPYSGIIYYNNTFIGCQAPNKDLGIYYNTGAGMTPDSSRKLVETYYDAQCTVVGDYYCLDSVWHKDVVTSEGTIVPSSQQMSLKKMPEGPELIRYGFRGAP